MRYKGVVDPCSGIEYGGGTSKPMGYIGTNQVYKKRKRNLTVLKTWKRNKIIQNNKKQQDV